MDGARIFDHPVLGRFEEWDRVPGFWQGKAQWCGTPIDLDLQVHDGTIVAAADHAVTLIDRAAGVDAEMAQQKVRDLFPIWQEEWSEGQSLTAEQWLARQAPQALSMHDNGEFTFYWADNDLFWGHDIQVRWREDAGYFDAGIVG